MTRQKFSVLRTGGSRRQEAAGDVLLLFFLPRSSCISLYTKTQQLTIAFEQAGSPEDKDARATEKNKGKVPVQNSSKDRLQDEAGKEKCCQKISRNHE